ncbi:hypothetical protein D3C81_2178130 [compost metagenome]
MAGKMENCKASLVFMATRSIIIASEMLMTKRMSSSQVGIGRIIISTIPIIPSSTDISFIFMRSLPPIPDYLTFPLSLYT